MDNAPVRQQPTIVLEWGERGAAAVCPGAAADLDVSTSVPLLTDGRFVDATSQPVPHHGARRARG